MKKIFHALFLSLLVAGLASCNNGDYLADPAASTNNAVNPVTPLTSSEFNWDNKDEQLAADINGARWKADYVTFDLDTSGANVITGHMNNSSVVLQLYLRDVWAGNVYSLEKDEYSRYGSFIDASSKTSAQVYYSYLMNNSGGLKITANDTSAIRGMFHFKAVNMEGQSVSVTKGVINVTKP